MSRRKKSEGDMEYLVCNRKKNGKYTRRVIAHSTVAIGYWLAIAHQQYPNASFAELREILTDRAQYMCSPDAISVLDAHINAGFGDCVPQWKYPLTYRCKIPYEERERQRRARKKSET